MTASAWEWLTSPRPQSSTKIQLWVFFSIPSLKTEKQDPKLPSKPALLSVFITTPDFSGAPVPLNFFFFAAGLGCCCDALVHRGTLANAFASHAAGATTSQAGYRQVLLFFVGFFFGPQRLLMEIGSQGANTGCSAEGRTQKLCGPRGQEETFFKGFPAPAFHCIRLCKATKGIFSTRACLKRTATLSSTSLVTLSNSTVNYSL